MKVKKLDIAITKATLQSYTVELKEGKPTISATIELMTEGGMSVTTYRVATDAWEKKDQFELPMSAIPPIVELAEILEGVVVRHCRDRQQALTATVEEMPIKPEDLEPIVLGSGETVDIVIDDIEDIDDKPIDLSEIPF